MRRNIWRIYFPIIDKQMENKIIDIHEICFVYAGFMYNVDFILHLFINDKKINPSTIMFQC